MLNINSSELAELSYVNQSAHQNYIKMFLHCMTCPDNILVQLFISRDNQNRSREFSPGLGLEQPKKRL